MPGSRPIHSAREPTLSGEARQVTFARRSRAIVRSRAERGPNSAMAGAAALRKLLQLESAPDAVWLETAARLSAVVRAEAQRNPRHAAIASLASAALKCTDAADLQDRQRARVPLKQSMDLLMSRIVPQDEEAGVARAFLETGWKLTMPYRGFWGEHD